MSWRYRIVRQDGYLSIREVHDTPDGRAWSAEPCAPTGASITELSSDLNLMLRAFQRPILHVNDELREEDTP